jgi:hypothetical protein
MVTKEMRSSEFMGYSYEEFLEDLNIGEEIEFTYKGEDYYIGRGTGNFMFWKTHDSKSEVMGENLEDLLSKVRLDRKSIMGLWDLIKVYGVS